MQQPLAYRMRPRHLDEVVGQQHLVGPGKNYSSDGRSQNAFIDDSLWAAWYW